MTEHIEKELADFRQHAKSIGMTPQEYALSLHEKNQAIKSVLLENSSDFKSFVSEYHEVLDGIIRYKETDAKKSSIEHSRLIQEAAALLSTTSQDPRLLAQLFQHYPKGIEGKIEELNKPTS
ncbi:hypothetical protein SAMN04488102_10571 [Alkalibacterium subtropicum]|uniref:Uncharacterized protein n=1 Tax=Alkalibacterium subtropicum TaxID=753702 RepID=A0A1I1IDV4_9LACT|nr:hypothetical protein [Alkalibacterium subtropicum]SFC34414.1 hypothetical protein SAMN04488102_10571 [Alkalibacterium subtropicum]